METSNRSAPPRPVIADVHPRVEDGRYDAKATAGELVEVSADAFADGHDLLAVEVAYRHESKRRWTRVRMASVGNDRWRAMIELAGPGRYHFQVHARVDHFATWLHELRARVAARQDVSLELRVGLELAKPALAKAKGADRAGLAEFVGRLEAGRTPDLADVDDHEITALVGRHHTTSPEASSAVYGIRAERERARFSTWYELFPRSTSARRGTHGTFRDVLDRLDYVADLGADVLYLPPIHPIGTTARKGPNGAPSRSKKDVGSPWAIGSPEGGHTAIHPELGSYEDFDKLVAAARDRGIDVALDLAFQCSPDHPWVTEHPEWFKHRPDGSIRYAENPPKKYEDVYPLDFETEHWHALWSALLDVTLFWVGHGVTVFRVDNPHTKPFAFWEWLIPTVQQEHPEVLFLAEAFTRPKIMKQLAKLGFTQSYTYFAWRTEKWELEQYLTELTKTDVADYFRPNFWPNTPDILTAQLQHGDRRTFMVRALLAGTLAASWGMYGPVFELCETRPRHEGSEEYLDGEKYEIRRYDLASPASIAPFISRLNAARRAQTALQHDRTLEFHGIDNDQLIAYSKTVPGSSGLSADAAECPVLVIVNLDARYRQSAWIDVRLDVLGLDVTTPYVVHDLLTDQRYEWRGSRNFVILEPDVTPGHIFRVEPPGGVLE